MLAVVYFTLAIFRYPAVYANIGLDPEQKRVLDSGIPFFNIKGAAPCTASSAGGIAANIDVDKEFSLGVDVPGERPVRRSNLIRALMRDFDLTAEQAAGPVGNFMVESGGPHLPPDINEGRSGTGGEPPRFSGGYGWAQWTGGRQRAFIDFAIEGGYMGSKNERATDAANYAYLKKELVESEKTTIPALKQQSSPEDAAVSFEATFERAGVPALEKRKEGARTAFNEFSGGDTSSNAGSGGSSNNCKTGEPGATIVGDYAFPLLINSPDGINNPGMFKNNTADRGGHPYIAFDILADPGVPVAAFVGGVVISISKDKCPGRLISIYNQESDMTISYLHLSFNGHVKLGDTVRAGDKIGVVGSNAEGCGISHLHIDATKGRGRPSCKRESCPPENASKFVDIGPQLFETFNSIGGTAPGAGVQSDE